MSNEALVTIENARLAFRNFAGKEGEYNRKGDRNFCVLLDPEFAEKLAREGWNIKELKGNEDEAPRPYLAVAVSFKVRPPRLVLITLPRGRTALSQDTVEVLDWMEFDQVDLVLRPYDWEVAGRTGKKAYLKTGFFITTPDPIEQKYEELDSE